MPSRNSEEHHPPSGSLAIEALVSVNGIPFGTRLGDLYPLLGDPDQAQQNYTGEFEMAYGNTIYRCLGGRLVECTFPDRGRISVNGVEILSAFHWLGSLEDVLDIARFRVSPAYGIAYDYRDPQQGSITVFERGRWDTLLADARRR
jgi:hypothetical protein